MSRSYRELQQAGMKARLEKLLENDHKKGFDDIDLMYVAKRLLDEVLEFHDALLGAPHNYEEMRRELADIGNFADMGILKCDREMKR